MSKLPPLPLKSTQQTGPRMHCCLAQIFDADGNAVASIESTDDPAQATELAALFAEAPGLRLRIKELEAQLAGGQEPDMLAICAALGFGPTNHHNAAKCPYCSPAPAKQPLRDEQIFDFGPGQPDAVWSYEDQLYFARAIEAAHGIKVQP
jgi:hypothetical protein